MKKLYEVPTSVQVDLLVEDGILGLSGDVHVNDKDKPGSDSWSQKKNPIW